MASLYGGWATPSEAAGLGAVLSLFFVMTIYRIYRPARLWKIFLKAMNESSMILMIMASALLFAYVSSDLYATQALGELILKMPLGKWGILFMVNILLLLLGCRPDPAEGVWGSLVLHTFLSMRCFAVVLFWTAFSSEDSLPETERGCLLRTL